MEKIQIVKVLRSYWIHILIILVLTYFIQRSILLSIYAQNCLTRTQIASDSRCLYIYGANFYEKGTRSKPHQGHTCGIDVTTFIPSFHTKGMAAYMDPNLAGAVCTDTPSPTPTKTLTSTPSQTPTPTRSQTPTPSKTPTLTPSVTASPSSAPTSIQPTTTVLLGDINKDANVTIEDLLQFLPNFTISGLPGFTPSDINLDGVVDIFDLNIIDTNYGKK